MFRRFVLAFSVFSTVSCTETVNISPDARLSAPETGRIGDPISVDASESSDAEGTALTYTLDFGDGTDMVRGIARADHVYEKAGKYTIQLSVKDEGGKSASVKVEISISDNEPPLANLAGPVVGVVGQALAFDGAGSHDADGEITTYNIDFGDGTTPGSRPAENHVYGKAGAYTVTLTVTDNDKAVTKAQRAIQIQSVAQISPAPTAKLTAAYQGIAGKLLTFDASASTYPGALAEFRHYFGDASYAAGRSVNHRYALPGDYTALLMLIARYPDGSTAVSIDAQGLSIVAENTVNPSPVARFTIPAQVRFNTPVIVDAAESSAPGAALVAYDWDFGDGASGPGVSLSHLYPSSGGTYNVQLTLTATYSDGSVAQTRANKIITISPNLPPLASLSGDSEGLASNPLFFNASASSDADGVLVSTRIDFGDGQSTSYPSASHSYAVPGTYSVRVTVTDNDGDVAISSRVVTIRAYSSTAVPPQTVLSGPSMLAVGVQGIFSMSGSNAPGASTWFRTYFGDGTYADGLSVAHAYMTAGNHVASVLLRATYPDGSTNTATATLPIVVNTVANASTTPVASFTAPASSRYSNPVPFDAGASTAPGAATVTYDWNFGDATNASGVAVTHPYASSGGQYTAVLTLTATYSDGSTASAQASRVIDIQANSAPVADLSGDTNGLASDPLFFDAMGSTDADGSIIATRIDFGDGQWSSYPSATHIYAAPGTYAVQVTVSDNDGATASTLRIVTVRAYRDVATPPSAVLAGPSALMVGAAGRFSASGSLAPDAAVWYRIYFGDGSYSDGVSVSHAYASPADSIVTLLLRATYPDGSTNTATAVLPVSIKTGAAMNIAPSAVASVPATIRFNAPLVVDASASTAPGANLIAYKWYFGDGATAQGASANHTYSASSGLFQVALMLTATYADGSTATAQTSKIVALMANASPIAVLNGPAQATIGESLAFDSYASSDPDGRVASQVWDFGDGTTSASTAPIKSYAAAGTFTVLLQVTDNDGAAATVARQIRVYTVAQMSTPPTANFSAPSVIGVSMAATFDGSRSMQGSDPIQSYFWKLGDGRGINGPSVVNISYPLAGTYTVALVVTSTTGLSSEISRQITVRQTYVTLDSVTPASGTLNGGGQVTLSGSNFDQGFPAVLFDGVAGLNVSVLDPNRLVVTVPGTGTPGAIDVVVSNSGGSAVLTRGYTYTAGGQVASSAFNWDDATVVTSLGVPLGADDAMYTIALPFDVRFYGRTYIAGENLNVSTNGWLSFVTTTNRAGKVSIPSDFNPQALIAPFFFDLQASTAAGSGIFYHLNGTAPNRVLTIEWFQFTDLANGAGATPFTFEVSIYEGTGNIKFQYLNSFGAANAAGESALIGLQNDAVSGTQISNDTFQSGLAPGGRTYVFHNTATGYGLETGGGLTVALMSPDNGTGIDTGWSPLMTIRFSNPVVPASVSQGGALTFTDTSDTVSVPVWLTWNAASDTATVYADNRNEIWRGHNFTLDLSTAIKDVFGNTLNQTPLAGPTGFTSSFSAPDYGRLDSDTFTGTAMTRLDYSTPGGIALVIGIGDTEFSWYDSTPRFLGGGFLGNTARALSIDPWGIDGYVATNNGIYGVSRSGGTWGVQTGTSSFGVVATVSDIVYSRTGANTVRRISYGGGTLFTTPNLTGGGFCGGTNIGTPEGIVVNTATDEVYTFTQWGYVAEFTADLSGCNWQFTMPGNTYSYGAIKLRNNSDLWVAAGSDGVQVLSLAGANLGGSPIAVNFAQDIAFSPDNAYAFISDPSQGSIVVVTTATRAIVGTYPVDGGVDYMATIDDQLGGVQPKVRLLATDGFSIFQTQ